MWQPLPHKHENGTFPSFSLPLYTSLFLYMPLTSPLYVHLSLPLFFYFSSSFFLSLSGLFCFSLTLSFILKWQWTKYPCFATIFKRKWWDVSSDFINSLSVIYQCESLFLVYPCFKNSREVLHTQERAAPTYRKGWINDTTWNKRENKCAI